MTIKKTLFTAGLAALALAASIAGASAASAVATGTVNVRSGPGTSYDVVDRLRGGDLVDVSNCRGSWCYIERRGTQGWVSANYLDSGRGYNDDYYQPPVIRRPPPPPPRYYGGYDDGYYYRDRPRHYPRPQWENRRPPRSSACFGGPDASFCISQ